MNNYSTAEPSNLSKETIFTVAEHIAKRIGYNSDRDIYGVLDDIGGRINIRDFWEPDGKTGSLIVHRLGDFDIYIPEHTTMERNRFTIAHELGHYILHCVYKRNDINLPMLADRYGSGRAEWEANWFAAAFLMPANNFKKLYLSSHGNVLSVAREFGVSEKAAAVRAKALGLMT